MFVSGLSARYTYHSNNTSGRGYVKGTGRTKNCKDRKNWYQETTLDYGATRIISCPGNCLVLQSCLQARCFTPTD